MSEQKLQKLLTYLKKHYDSHVREPDDGVFIVPHGLVKVDDPAFNNLNFDEKQITIDFNKKEATWWAAFTSGHNGSSFGDERGKVSWVHVQNSFEAFSTHAIKFVLIDIERDREKQRREAEESLAKCRLEKMLQDD